MMCLLHLKGLERNSDLYEWFLNVAVQGPVLETWIVRRLISIEQ